MRPETIPVYEVASAILYNPRGELLLQLRDDKPTIPFPNMWTPFGGQIEPGETADEGIRRELVEELELDVPLTHWRMFPCPVRTDPGKLICMHHSYMGMIDRDLDSLTQHEGQGRGFFSASQIATLDVAFGQKELLLEFCAVYLNDGSLRPPLA